MSSSKRPKKSVKKTKAQHSFSERALLSEQSKKFDPDATASACIDSLRQLQKQNPLKHITRNFYRHFGMYSESTWTRFFGTFQEFRRQAGLEPTRYQHAMERHIAKHASLDHYPEWYRKQIEPITMMYSRAERKRVLTVAAMSDNHDRKQDPFVWRVFIDVIKDMHPDVIAFNGDQNDLYEFSRFGIDPRQADVVASMQFVRDRLFREAREACPNSEIIWNLGNHEWRIMKHMADSSPYLRAVLSDFHGWSWAELFGVKELQINVNCKWDLRAFNQKDVAEQVKQNFLVLWECFALKHIIDTRLGISGTSGHTHRPETRSFVNLSNRGARSPHTWTVTGSGCRGNAEYVESLDQSSQGFALFHIMPDTGIVVPENVIIQGDFAAVGGRYWYRRDDER